MSVFVPAPCCFCYYSSVVQFVVRDGDSVSSSSVIQNGFSNPGFFSLLYEAENFPFKISEELCWNFNGVLY